MAYFYNDLVLFQIRHPTDRKDFPDPWHNTLKSIRKMVFPDHFQEGVVSLA
jgi:hypothetical protein